MQMNIKIFIFVQKDCIVQHYLCIANKKLFTKYLLI